MHNLLVVNEEEEEAVEGEEDDRAAGIFSVCSQTVYAWRDFKSRFKHSRKELVDG